MTISWSVGVTALLKAAASEASASSINTSWTTCTPASKSSPAATAEESEAPARESESNSWRMYASIVDWSGSDGPPAAPDITRRRPERPAGPA